MISVNPTGVPSARIWRMAALAAVLFATGCDQEMEHGGGLDSGPIAVDAGASGSDAGAGLEDAGNPCDGGPGDDAGAPDAGDIDAGDIDAGLPDAGLEDAGPEDAGPEDAGPRDPCGSRSARSHSLSQTAGSPPQVPPLFLQLVASANEAPTTLPSSS